MAHFNSHPSPIDDSRPGVFRNSSVYPHARQVSKCKMRKILIRVSSKIKNTGVICFDEAYRFQEQMICFKLTNCTGMRVEIFF